MHDNGKGMGLQMDQQEHGSYGIRNMRKRTNEIGAAEFRAQAWNPDYNSRPLSNGLGRRNFSGS